MCVCVYKEKNTRKSTHMHIHSEWCLKTLSSDCLLPLHKNTIKFCLFVLYPILLLNFVIDSSTERERKEGREGEGEDGTQSMCVLSKHCTGLLQTLSYFCVFHFLQSDNHIFCD